MNTDPKSSTLVHAIRTAGFSGILVILWLLLPMIFSTRRNIDSYNSLDQTAIIQLSMCAIGGIYGALQFCVSSELRHYIFATALRWYFAYLTYCLLLSPFSYNPAYSAVALLDIIGFTLTVMALNLRFKENYEANIRWLCATGFLFSMIVIAKDLDRDWLHIENWHDAAVFATFPVMFLPLYQWRKFKISFCLMLALAFLSTSVKVYLGLIVAIGIYFLLLSKRHQIWAVLLLFGAVLFILGTEDHSGTFIGLLTSTRSEGAIETGNGRFTVWPFLLEMGWQSPWTGYGFAMAEKVAINYIGIYMSSSHNVFLSTFLYAGLGGVGLFSMFIFSCLRYLYRTGKRIPFANILLVSFIAIVVFICFDQGLGNKLMIATYSQTLFLCFAVKFCCDQNKKDEN